MPRGRDRQQEFSKLPIPDREKGEMYAIAEKVLGGPHISVICEDGKTRLGRIKGKLLKRMWIQPGDLLIVRPWPFQDEKADILFRYTKTEALWLSRKGLLPEELNVFE